MAENKTRPTDADPHAFIAAVENAQRRRDAERLVVIMSEITGCPPVMWGPSIVGFGQYHYRYASGREGISVLTGFSPRRRELVLYVGHGLEDERLRAKLGRHKTGRVCLYLRSLADVDETALRAIIRRSVDFTREQHPG
jgi:hypothetical protein